MTPPPPPPPFPLSATTARAACRYERHRVASPRWAVLFPLGHAEFPGTPASVPTARRWARDLLSGRLSDTTLDDALLLLSEVVTNAVVHSDSGREPYGSVTVCVALSNDHGDSTVHVEVIDDGSDGSLPFVRAATTDSDGGRGLLMVELLSARWGVHHDETGNAVWFHLPDRPDRGVGRG
ncbi:ATP-binding protein [Streptosporangium sp. NPDC051023]|uniref:ATP-binding protein n=1 Tax=Streptosporangium sp. NPDC051023 TaxID=3155410 RepID=UPI00344EEEDE